MTDGPPRRVEVVFKPSHLVPAALQVVLFAYWALYWPPVRAEVPWILTQLAFAWALDLALGLLTSRRLVVSVAVLPVVFSTNLFVWFPPGHGWLAFLVLALALGSKAFLRRDGRHVFNPSAFGIALVGLLCLVFPETFRYTDIAHELDVPPNMTELVLLLALVAQLRFPIVPISILAALSMLLVPAIGITSVANPFWSPVFLAVVLLATDPATIPKTPMGRVLYGTLLGLGIALLSRLFLELGENDYFSKVLPIPVVNLLAPSMDAVGRRLEAWLDAWLESWPARLAGGAPRPARAPLRRALATSWNGLHVVAWVVLVTGTMHANRVKPWQFEGSAVLRRTSVPVPLLVRGPGGDVRCDENPVFCEVFSFPEELRLWLDRAP